MWKLLGPRFRVLCDPRVLSAGPEEWWSSTFNQSISEKALQPIIFEVSERYQFFTLFCFVWIGGSRHCLDATAVGLN